MSLPSQVAVPRVAWPLQINATTGANVVEQGSFEDTLTQVRFLAACEIGQCPELPTFGIPDLTFQVAPPRTDQLVGAIQQWVPSAEETAVARALDDTGSSWAIQLDTTVTGTGQ